MRILIEHLMYAWWVITFPSSNSAHIVRTSDVSLVGYYLPLMLLGGLLIVHILLEHLMYAWKIITCSCSNSAHIDRTSDVCLVGYYLPLF